MERKIPRFGRKGKLSPRFIRPYEILERVGPVAYLELASRAGGWGWAEPTPGQENNRADRAGLDLNLAAISLTQPSLYRASGLVGQRASPAICEKKM